MSDSAARWRALEELFQSASGRDRAARAEFLSEACPDSGLRREVQAMLDAQASGDQMLERPALDYAMQPIESGSMLGPYRIAERIGSGGMGEVYRAMDTRLRREAAIKTLPAVYAADPEWLARFEAEARVLASLNHPRIAAIYGLGEAGVPALAMELVEGPTLADRIARGALPIGEALRIAKQIAEALEYAHEKGVIHCDLKPANVKLADGGAVKVLDFGLAKAAGESTARAGEVFGTPGYMSPEQASGGSIDRRVDIWSFGAVLWEMLAGRRVATDPAWQDLPRDTPAGILRLLKRCLTKDPKQRLRDIGESRIAIEEVERGESAEPVRPSDGFWRIAAVASAGLWIAALCAWAWSGGWFRARPVPLGAARIEIALPEGTAPWPDAAFPNAVPSPDGRMVAFTAVSGGKTALWLQALDSLKAQRLENTESAYLPFWAPDSKSIAFFANGQLKRISAAGGAPQALCLAGGYGGGAWGRAGVILFADGGGLKRVPEGGGDPTPVTYEKEESGERDHAWPQFLPDGRRFLYLAYDGGSTGAIYLQELGSATRTLVLKTPWRALYASGRLLFVRRHALLAQPFNWRTSRLYGDAVPLVSHVNTQPGGFATPIAASENGVMVYRADDAPPVLTWFDREGRMAGTLGFPGEFSGPAISPDGSWLAVAARLPATEKRDIFLFDLVRGGIVRMTTDPADDMNPTWSPDGRRIAFNSDRRGRRETYVKNPFGTAQEELISTDANGGENLNDWSPDGRLIAFETFPGTQHISMLSMETGKIEAYSFSGEHRAHFSPDGRWVAYQSKESGRAEVYVQPFPATGAKWQISTSGGFQPQWRGDGKELFYANEGRPAKIMAVDISLQSGAVAAGIPHPLFAVQMTMDGRNGWTVSRDGKRFLVIVPQKQAGASNRLPVIFNWPAIVGRPS